MAIAPSILDADAREYFEERAGMYEFGAGFDREESELRAWDDVQKKFNLPASAD